MIQVFYHEKDLDGWASGAIVKYYYSEHVELIPYDYHKESELPELLYEQADRIYFVDCSANPKFLEEFDKKFDNIYIIDHHKSFIEKEKENGYIFKGIRDTSKAGCQLTWDYFHPRISEPEFIRLLGRYDIWDKSDDNIWNNRVMPFQMAMRTSATEPLESMEIWNKFIDTYLNDLESFYSLKNMEEIQEMIDKGEAILEYQKKQDRDIVRRNSFYSTFEGLRVICLNSQRMNSQLFDSVDENSYDVMLVWNNISMDKITVSLYSKNDIDVSVMAKKYGGGGHKQAAGFICSRLDLKDPIEVINE